MTQPSEDTTAAKDAANQAWEEWSIRQVMEGTRWVYPRRQRHPHPDFGRAVGDDDAHVAVQPGRELVGQRLKSFLRKLLGWP